VKNGFVEDQLDKQSVWERRKVDLLEESQASQGTTSAMRPTRPSQGVRPVPAKPPAQAVRSSGAAAGTRVSSGVGSRSIPPQTSTPSSTVSTLPAISSPSTAPAVLVGEIKSRPLALASTTLKDNPGEMTELLSGLTIRERPTPPTVPLPPSLDAPRVVVKDDPIPPDPTSRREAGSLIATPAKLATNFLTAQKQMGPIAQLGPDSDEEEEEGGGWADEWGVEDDEMRGLFEQAKAAQEVE